MGDAQLREQNMAVVRRYIDAINRWDFDTKRELLADDAIFEIVDELRLWVMPVVVGSGQHLFEGVDAASLNLTLTDVRRLANNSAILTYVPN
jgi:hypothetical protein